LTDGLIALKDDKVTVINIFKLANHAAHIIDNKFDSAYIKRYINIEKLFKTTAISFYFVHDQIILQKLINFERN
jgi:hypothetical protein